MIERMRRLIGAQGFPLAMLAAVSLALLYPAPGANGGALHLSLLTDIGVALVFFFHGANLAPETIRNGAGNWRLHLTVHGSTFVLFPLIGLAALKAGVLPHQPALATGFLYLCTLPSTVTSSVALTAVARGNVAGAIFNASASGLIGMVATPVLLALLVSAQNVHIPIGPAVLNIARELFAPFLLGQILRPRLRVLFTRYRGWISRLDKAVVVTIVYGAFCESTASGVWQQTDWIMLAQALLMCVILLLGVWTMTRLLARAIDMPIEDEIAAVFCGSKKSLANGMPIAKILFAGHPAFGLIVLPMMLYHQLQLLLFSVVATRYGQRERRGLPATADH